jgi:hypothetical protein
MCLVLLHGTTQDKARNALLRAAVNDTNDKWHARLESQSGAQARPKMWAATEHQRMVRLRVFHLLVVK